MHRTHNVRMNHFSRALDLAARAMTLSNPNPRVGCVIVAADGRVLGEGFTQQRGGPHAEVMALRDAAARGNAVAGSTVYVTLEPCAHHGRTPPCCDALAVARVAEVRVALPDPNPLVAGQGMARLQAAGIATRWAAPEVALAAWQINIGFFSRMVRQRPWVRVKTASSLDGITALHSGNSQWITGAAARADGQHWRARACAVLTGSGTVLQDDPLLNVRLPDALRQPDLVVLDSSLRTPPQARLLQVPQRRVWLCSAGSTDANWQQRRTALEANGAEVLVLPAAANGKKGAHGKPDLHALLAELAQREVNELHVEAGATLNGALQQAGLVDEWLAYVAPRLLGAGMPLAALPAVADVNQAPGWELLEATRLEQDVRLRMVQGCFWREPSWPGGLQLGP